MGVGQHGFDLGILFLGHGAGEEGCHGGIHIGLQFLGRREARRPIRVEQPEGGERVRQLAADAVIDGHRIGVLRQADFAAGGGVEGLFPVDDEDLAAGHVQIAIGHGLQDAIGIGVGAHCNFPDGGHLLGGILGGQTPDLGRVHRRLGGKAGGPKGDNTECSDHGAPSAFLCGAAPDYGPAGGSGIR